MSSIASLLFNFKLLPKQKASKLSAPIPVSRSPSPRQRSNSSRHHSGGASGGPPLRTSYNNTSAAAAAITVTPATPVDHSPADNLPSPTESRPHSDRYYYPAEFVRARVCVRVCVYTCACVSVRACAYVCIFYMEHSDRYYYYPAEFVCARVCALVYACVCIRVRV